MQLIKRIILTMFTGALCVSGSALAFADSNSQSLQNIQQQLDQQAQAKQSVNNQIQGVQQEIQSINTYISQNQASLDSTQKKITETNQLIEEKKQEIVTLEDKILARKDVMKKRIIALQHDDDNLSLVIKVFLDSKNLNDFIQRASAVTALFSADQDILTAQKNDLSKIEEVKKEIDRQGQVLANEQKTLALQQEDLAQNLQKRQTTLTSLQDQFNQIDQQMSMAQQEKASIVAQIQAAQVQLQKQQAAAQARAAAAASSSQTDTNQPAGSGQEMYVTATAYNPEEYAYITTSGYNIMANPNMKLIAVDPSVIPLGKKVWVEGYGVAIAGDTGGAIKGNRIDVLMPTRADALAWGRQAVKIVILN